MTLQFAVGDRVIVVDADVARVPLGTVGTIIAVFHLLEMYDVQFDDRRLRRVVRSLALARAPIDSPPA